MKKLLTLTMVLAFAATLAVGCKKKEEAPVLDAPAVEAPAEEGAAPVQEPVSTEAAPAAEAAPEAAPAH